MRKIVIDIENTTTKLNDKYSDYTPYNPNNKLVSVGWGLLDKDNVLLDVEYVFLYHKDIETWNLEDILNKNLLIKLKVDLENADVVIAHNAKYDIQWLEECGFDLGHLKIEDTMIREYIMARGRSDISFKLADTCKRYGVAEKGELFSKYPDLSIAEMPIAEVEEYGRADVQACAELYQAQEERLAKDSYLPLRKTVDMTNEMCRVLVDMERAGVKIDDEALRLVEKEFTEEAEQLKFELNKFIATYMGDTKVNLDSPQQLSEVIYSRRIKEGKEEDWVKTFNIGKDTRNKNLKRPKMSFAEYADNVKHMCDTVMKTVVSQCEVCTGQGHIQKIKKDGSLWKKQTRCKPCDGTGAIYTAINEIAGFKMRPENIHWTTVSGFSTGQTFLTDLLTQAKEQGKEDAYSFIEKLMRLSSISSYLSNFVGGISTFKQLDNILHTNFNQCITATGRLSSTKPNLQNMPREATFPIRKTFISRFKDGKIIDTDFCQLEFRTAVHLAKDERGKKDILDGKDLHQQTCDIITAAGQSTTRQGAKRHCVPITTRILSKEGFKLPEEVKVGDLVLTHNTKTGFNEWQPLLAINYYDNVDVYMLHNQFNKFYSTAEHRWIGRKLIHNTFRGPGIKKFREFTTKEMTTTYDILRSAPMKDSNIHVAAFWKNVELFKSCNTSFFVKIHDDVDIEATHMSAIFGGLNIRPIVNRPRHLYVLNGSYTSGDCIKRDHIHKMRVWCPTTANGTWVMKQGNTISITGNSFKPLYAGQSGTEAEKKYYKSFLNDIYTGIKAWHKVLEEEAIRTKMVVIESGRQYLFPNAERAWHGGVTGKTQIVNWPVQGLATADLVQIAAIRLHTEMKMLNLQSKMVLLVHDSCVVDAHPDEINVVINLMKKLGDYAMEEAKLRYGIDMYVPLTVECKIGDNAMELKKVS